MRGFVGLAVLSVGMSIIAGSPLTSGHSTLENHMPRGASALSVSQQKPHRNHNPKHGGTFFMSMDSKHHLEGTFGSPGIFRVYLYDAYTDPLSEAEMKKVHGSIQIGETDSGPVIPLIPGSKKETLEANLGDRVRFPVTISLRLYLPGMDSSAKPELFNFKFAEFTVVRGSGNCSPMANMPNMGC